MPYTRPGVYVSEANLPNIASFGSRLATAAFIGTALRGPTTPKRIESWGQFVTSFEGFSGSHDLPHSVFHYFANGGRVAWVTRVVGTGATSSTYNLSGTHGVGNVVATVVTMSAGNPGTWGTGITIQTTALASRTAKFDITVLYQGAIVETWKDLSMQQEDARYVETVINSGTTGSTYISVAVPAGVKTTQANGEPITISAVAGTAMTGGVAGAAPASGDWATAVTAQTPIEGPFLLNLVGQSSSTIINNAISFASGRGDVFVIVDPDAASSANKTIGTIPSYTQSSFVAAYYPRVIFIDPSSPAGGATRVSFPGGAVAGLYVRTDTERGVFKAPAGTSAVIGGALALEYRPSDAEYGTLNDSHTNAFKAIVGVGVVSFGARTMKRDTIDMYIPARRSLIYLTQAMKDSTAFAVFEPNDEVLWSSIRNRATKIMDDFWRQGGLKGLNQAQAYFIICDESNNTPASIGAGEVHLEVGAALQAPAEFVIIRLGQWTGGTSVTELL